MIKRGRLHPTQVKILQLLHSRGKMTVYQIARELNMFVDLVRYHTKILVSMGIVLKENNPNRKGSYVYSINDEMVFFKENEKKIVIFINV